MDFKSLHYIIAIAENGGISAAARKLGISQPSLSKFVQNLTASLGIPLFERTEDALVPTYAGERYVAAARQILRTTGEFDHVAVVPKKKELRITFPPFEGSYIHAFAIKQFCEKYPDIRLAMLESPDTAELLRSGQADMAVTPSRLPDNEFSHIQLTRDEILLVTSMDHPVVKQAVWREGCAFPWVDVTLLWGERLVQLHPDQQTRILSDALLANQRVTLDVFMQTRSVLNAIRVAATGAAVCFAPALHLRLFSFNEQPAYFSVGPPLAMDVHIVHRHDVEIGEWGSHFIGLMAGYL